MKLRSIAISLSLLIASLGLRVSAAAVPVTIETTAITAIQTYSVGDNATDQVYLLVTAIHDGKTTGQRIPPDKTWVASPKQPPIEAAHPVQLWKGELDDGQYVLLTVTLMQGKGSDDARNKQFSESLDKVTVPPGGKLASESDVKNLAQGALSANQAVVKKIKDTYSRDKNTDHFGGQFTVIIWNNGGKLVKRLDPVGLTFGEHFGNDVKIYSKLKNTRANVLVKDENGKWAQQQVEPLNDDQTAIRVKMLETEYLGKGKDALKHVTDYLVEIQALGGDGKPLTWDLKGEYTGDAIHEYWNWAE